MEASDVARGATTVWHAQECVTLTLIRTEPVTHHCPWCGGGWWRWRWQGAWLAALSQRRSNLG